MTLVILQTGESLSKTCFKCGQFKPLTEFYRHPKMADGYVNKCKECNKKDVRTNYSKNRDHYLAYEKTRANLPHRVQARFEYAQTEAGKITGNRAKRKWADKNPIKRSVTYVVNNAVRDGKLFKPSSCSECGKTGRIEGHHDDYSKPLDVRWLCPACHTNWHKQNGEGKNANPETYTGSLL